MAKTIEHPCKLEGEWIQIRLLEPENVWEEQLIKDIIVGAWERNQREWPAPIAWDHNVPGDYEYYNAQIYDRIGAFYHFVEDRLGDDIFNSLSYAILAEESDGYEICKVVYFNELDLYFSHAEAYRAIGNPVEGWAEHADEDFTFGVLMDDKPERVNWSKEGL